MTYESAAMEFYATCPTGFEAQLARELRSLDIPRVRPLKGRVAFEGEARNAYRACLWSRLASRVLVVLGRFSCHNADELYEGAYRLPWEDIVRLRATIAVNVSGATPQLKNTHYSALCVKDAIVDRMIDETGRRPDVDTKHPDARIAVSIQRDRASVSLDLSGEPLFKRGAAARRDACDLRPDYAALVLAAASWPELCRTSTHPVLADVSPQTGVLGREAHDELHRCAPGLDRSHWGFEGWTQHDAGAWIAEREAARERAQRHRDTAGHILALGEHGASSNEDAALAHANACAIVGNLLPLSTSRLPLTLNLITQLCAAPEFKDAPIALLSAGAAPCALPGRPQPATTAVRPGNEEATLAIYAPADTLTDQANDAHATSPALQASTTVDVGSGKPVPVLVPASEQFAHRLQKVARLRRRWAKREGVSCYRVYDADLPDYAVAIDLFVGAPETPGRWLQIAEYAAPKTIDPALAQARMLDILSLAPRILDVDPACAHAKTRMRSRGGSQYAKKSTASVREGGTGSAVATGGLPHINEGGLTFIVNFDDYLDCGIFLDHRVTRSLVREHMHGKQRFLNLFAYTGTATCYAADGGAQHTTTVDLSNTYLDWARRNMQLNGFTGRNHTFERADVLSWIREQGRSTRRWDLIFCDPPTFSNSTKMGQRTFDVQRDHVELLCGVAKLLAAGGEAIFSCNLRSFKPDVDALACAGIAIEDITAATIPEDYARNKRIHCCYIVRNA